MGIKVTLENGWGDGSKAKISEEGVINVIAHNHPPVDDVTNVLPYRDNFRNAGSIDMNVDGSVTNQVFSISASPDFNIYIKYISIEIGDDGSPALNKFGNLTELTNGVEWSFFTQKEGDTILHDGIKTNKAFIRIGGDTPAIGDGTTAFLADVTGGGTEKSYLISIDVAETFGMPFGIRLRKGTTDTLSFTVRDDLSTLLTFDAIAFGIRL